MCAKWKLKMNRQNNIPKIKGKQRILIAPLNWGLGHASRCIPIIHELIAQGHEIVIGTRGLPFYLLHEEFPGLKFIKFRSFHIKYSKGNSQVGAVLLNLPQIILQTWTEHQRLKWIINKRKITYVISDNRFGLWTKKVPCVYITHQLMIKLPSRYKKFEHFAWWLHGRFIKRYTECWIPDFEEDGGLSGDLAHKYPLPENARFIGSLSRFTYLPDIKLENKYNTVIVISGPEPQRSMFEREMLNQFQYCDDSVLIVQGLPSLKQIENKIENITLVSHLPAVELKAHLKAAKQIFCRSGYSSIMDLYAISKKANFSPTPGQPEQEYLATIH